MKKKTLITSALLLCLSLTACGHEHTFSEATCTVPMTCSECGITEGEASGHVFSEATCDTAMTCDVCGITEGEALGHTWVEATCDTAKTCSVCGATEGNPLEHSWIAATTEAPKTCELCGLTDGEPLVVEEETETEEVEEETENEETTEGCRNTVPEEEVQWYLDNLHLTRQEFDQKTDEELSALVMQWLEDMANQSNSGVGNTGGGNNSGSNEDDPGEGAADLPLPSGIPEDEVLPGTM